MVSTLIQKIAYIGQKGVPALWGGVERSTEELAVRMAQSGYEVTTYCRAWYTINRPASYRGISLVYLPSIRTKHLDAITHTFVSIVHALWDRTDVIHFQGIGPALLAWIPYFFAPRVKILVTFHCHDRRLSKWNTFSRIAFWFGEWITMKCADEVFVTSRFLQDYSYEVWGRTVTYLPNGVFEDAHEAVPADFLQTFKIQSNKYIVCVGRLTQDKAQHEVIEAFLRMKERVGGDFPELKLVFVGDTLRPEEYRERLFAVAQPHRDIIFAGIQTGTALKALMSHATCAVQSSHSEGMPLAVLELGAFGVPLVLSDIPAHREIFGSAHVYTEVGNVAHISEQLERVIRNRDQAHAIALIESKRIALEYRWEVIAARYRVSLVSFGSKVRISALPL